LERHSLSTLEEVWGSSNMRFPGATLCGTPVTAPPLTPYPCRTELLSRRASHVQSSTR